MPTIFSVYSQLCDEIDEHDKKIPAEIIETDSDTKKKIPGEVWSPSALGEFKKIFFLQMWTLYCLSLPWKE